jgi:hypothetical protein
MKIGGRGKLILALLALFGCVAAWQGFRYWWFHGYSTGERTGIIRKVSVRGSPVCKYMESEMALTASGVSNPEIWTFSIDDYGDTNPLMKQLREAERDGTRVTLHYRQDLKSWWRCNPNEYFITGFEPVPGANPTTPATAPSHAAAPAANPAAPATNAAPAPTNPTNGAAPANPTAPPSPTPAASPAAPAGSSAGAAGANAPATGNAPSAGAAAPNAPEHAPPSK